MQGRASDQKGFDVDGVLASRDSGGFTRLRGAEQGSDSWRNYCADSAAGGHSVDEGYGRYHQGRRSEHAGDGNRDPHDGYPRRVAAGSGESSEPDHYARAHFLQSSGPARGHGGKRCGVGGEAGVYRQKSSGGVAISRSLASHEAGWDFAGDGPSTGLGKISARGQSLSVHFAGDHVGEVGGGRGEDPADTDRK